MDKYVHTHTTGALHLIFVKAPNLSRNPEDADRNCQQLRREREALVMNEKSQQQLHFLSTVSWCLKNIPVQGRHKRKIKKGTKGIRPECRKVDVIETGEVWKSCDLLIVLNKARSGAGFNGPCYRLCHSLCLC